VLLSLNLLLPLAVGTRQYRENFFEPVMGRKYGSRNVVELYLVAPSKLDGLGEPLGAEKLERDMSELN